MECIIPITVIKEGIGTSKLDKYLTYPLFKELDEDYINVPGGSALKNKIGNFFLSCEFCGVDTDNFYNESGSRPCY